MACKINYFSLNEPLWRRYLRWITLLPTSEIFHRGLNIAWKRLHGGLLSFPQNVHVEVTNHCNLACPMCVFYKQKRTKGFMDFNLFEKIIHQCKGRRPLEKMALMGLGEPFLHPELIPMSRYAKSQGIYHIFTSTNATLLGERESKAIVSQPGFDLLIMSLDGATKSTYENIRRGADFDKVLINILTFLNIRRCLKKKRPRLVLEFLSMKENYQEKDIFVKFWKDKLDNQDIILFRDVDTFGGQVPDHRLSSQIPRRKRKACLQLWRDLIISWDGDVSVCCKDVNYILKVGNINESSLEDIWVNNKWKQLRVLHKQGRWDEIALCANCS